MESPWICWDGTSSPYPPHTHTHGDPHVDGGPHNHDSPALKWEMFPDISDGELVSATIALKAREVQLAIASQLNTSRDPSVA